MFCSTVLLQHGADPNIRNTDGKTALDLADASAKAVLTGWLHFISDFGQLGFLAQNSESMQDVETKTGFSGCGIARQVFL